MKQTTKIAPLSAAEMAKIMGGTGGHQIIGPRDPHSGL
jgi:hypothetical protein